MKNLSVSLDANPAASSGLDSFISIRVISAQTWLTAILMLLLVPNAFAQTDFSAFWKKFKSAVVAGDKAAVAGIAKFPPPMSYAIKAVKKHEEFLRPSNDIINGEHN